MKFNICFAVAIVLMMSLFVGCSKKTEQYSGSDMVVEENIQKAEEAPNVPGMQNGENLPSTGASDQVQNVQNDVTSSTPEMLLKKDDTENNPPKQEDENPPSTGESDQAQKVNFPMTPKTTTGIFESESGNYEKGITTRKKTLDWGDDVNIYHEIPVFPENSDTNKKINTFLSEVQDKFFENNLEYFVDVIQEGRDENPGAQYDYTVAPGVCQSQWVTSVLLMEYQDFGRVDVQFETYNFNRNTGELVSIYDIYPMSDGDIMSMVKKSLKSDLNKEWGMSQDYDDELSEEPRIDWDEINSMSASKLHFYVNKDNKVIILFGKMEIGIHYGVGAGEYELPKVKNMFKGEKFKK